LTIFIFSKLCVSVGDFGIPCLLNVPLLCEGVQFGGDLKEKCMWIFEPLVLKVGGNIIYETLVFMGNPKQFYKSWKLKKTTKWIKF
jgi:hypothetical protein